MTISYVNRGTQKNYSGASITTQTFTFTAVTDFPPTLAEGDFMLLITRQVEILPTAALGTEPSVPTGWTLRYFTNLTVDNGGGTDKILRTRIYTRETASASGTTFTQTWSGTNPTSGTYVSAIHAFRGNHIDISTAGGSGPVGETSPGTSPTSQASIPSSQPAYALSIAIVDSTTPPAKVPGLTEGFGVAPGTIIASGVHSRMIIDTKPVEASTVLFPAYNMANPDVWTTISLLLIEPPYLEPNVPVLDVGDAIVGDTAADSVFLTNVGAGDVVLQTPYSSIDQANWFHQPPLDAGFASGTARIPPGGVVEVSIWRDPVTAGVQNANYLVPYVERTLTLPLVATGVAPDPQTTCTVSFNVIGEEVVNSWTCVVEPPASARVGESWEILFTVTTSDPSDSVDLRYIVEWPTGLGEAELELRPINYSAIPGPWTSPVDVPKVNDPLPANGRYITQGFFPSWTGYEKYEIRLTGIAETAEVGTIQMATENLGA